MPTKDLLWNQIKTKKKKETTNHKWEYPKNKNRNSNWQINPAKKWLIIPSYDHFEEENLEHLKMELYYDQS